MRQRCTSARADAAGIARLVALADSLRDFFTYLSFCRTVREEYRELLYRRDRRILEDAGLVEDELIYALSRPIWSQYWRKKWRRSKRLVL